MQDSRAAKKTAIITETEGWAQNGVRKAIDRERRIGSLMCGILDAAGSHIQLFRLPESMV